jgi:predicted nucleic-acid-binding protein
MIGLYTNVLVRYLTQDDEAQAAVASRLIETQLSAQSPGFIGPVVLCELVWVLETSYGHTRAELAPILWKLLAAEEFRIPGRDKVVIALQAYESTTADFADALLGVQNLHADCETTVTFDKKAARLPTHRLLE